MGGKGLCWYRIRKSSPSESPYVSVYKLTCATGSYGSVVATHLLRSSKITQNIGPVLFVDPISFLLHLPDVAYNFVCSP